jgi:hypothetical protein
MPSWLDSCSPVRHAARIPLCGRNGCETQKCKGSTFGNNIGCTSWSVDRALAVTPVAV